MARLAYEKRRKYPRLRPEDRKIWERFIDKYPAFYESVEYDFKVGHGRDYPIWHGNKIQNGAVEHSKRRVDVVGYRGFEIHIIEIKPKAGGNALGQALEYSALFSEQYKGTESIIPTVITDVSHPDTERVASQLGVRILIA